MDEIMDLMISYRAKHNLSQEKLAELCHLTKQTIHNVETGLQTPSRLTRQKILEVVKKGEE